MIKINLQIDHYNYNQINYLILMVMLTVSVSCNTEKKKGYMVMRGPFTQSIVETGELQAVNASTLTMPRINSIYGYNFKIIELAEHGKQVQKGDPVFRVDPSAVQKYIIEKRESLENEIASANKLKAQIIRFLKPSATDSLYKVKKVDQSDTEGSLSLKGVKSDE